MGFLFTFSLKILQVEVGISYLISRFHLTFFFILISPHQQHQHHQNHQQHHHREHHESFAERCSRHSARPRVCLMLCILNWLPVLLPHVPYDPGYL